MSVVATSPLLSLPYNLSKQLEPSSRSYKEFQGLEVPMLDCEFDAEVADRILDFCCRTFKDRCVCSVAHNDLDSGIGCEQQLYNALAEREVRDRELKNHQEAKRKSGSEKDFSVSAAKRRAAEDGISVATARLAVLDEELNDLNRKKKEAPWYMLFSTLNSRRSRIDCLDLTNCCLHATGLVFLTQVMLEIEQREDDPIFELVLDGNNVGDQGMTAICTLLRLTSHLHTLRLRNVGLTERGVSQVLSGLVSNKTLKFLDLRANGLASIEVTKAAYTGVQRFNPRVEVLLE